MKIHDNIGVRNADVEVNMKLMMYFDVVHECIAILLTEYVEFMNNTSNTAVELMC